MISPTDSGVRTTLNVSITDSGSERVKVEVRGEKKRKKCAGEWYKVESEQLGGSQK